MARLERFTLLCNAAERQAINNLAVLLQRSQSDAVRFVVLEAERRLNQMGTVPNPKLPKRALKLVQGELDVRD